MNCPLFFRKPFCLFLLLAAAGPLRGQFSITGVTDRYYNYSDSVTFTVGTQSGYSFQVTLDTNRVPTGVPITVNQVDYHELRVSATNLSTGVVSNALVRFIVQSSTRSAKGTTENGIPPWTPWPVINSSTNEFAAAHLRVITPESFPAGYEIPVVAWAENEQGHAVRANGLLAAPGQPSIQLKRGAGSGFLTAVTNAGVLAYNATLAQMEGEKSISIESSTSWTTVSGTLSGNINWPANSRIAITNNLTILTGSTLTIGPASIVRLSPGVNINLDGRLVSNGTTNQPVVFMPMTHAQPWGGFFLSSSTSEVTATGTIFTGSGSGPTGGAGHRSEQCLFYCNNYAHVTLTDCAAIALAGQLGHSFDMGGAARYFFTFTRFLMQGATTSGEYTDAVFNVNDSAFIDFFKAPPPFQTFYDGDEDAFYIVNIPSGYVSGFTNTLIGWTRDDGVDSGGSGPGVLNFKSCWFESIYHEGNSPSGVQSSSAHADKRVTHIDDVFIGLGQGFENGYGAVTGKVDHCLMLGNLVGVRFGDNYNWLYYGLSTATNCILINNYHDVWGMTWQPDTTGIYAGWVYRTGEMDIRSNYLTTASFYHPSNTVWNPAADGWRLAAFMTTPPDASVGIGFVTWTNSFATSDLFDGMPVGLSGFTTNFVSVDYAFMDTNDIVLGTGLLNFAPGETVKRVYPVGFPLTSYGQLHLVLLNPSHGELTGQTNLSFGGSVFAPLVNCWLATNQTDLGRIVEGIPVKLSNPSSESVSVPYKFENGGGLIFSGTAMFAPGETVKWLPFPVALSTNEQLVRFSLSAPAGGAQLGALSNVFFVKNVVATTPGPTTFVASGATWKYYDTVTNTLANWNATNFPDSGWKSGPSPLGYNSSPAQTTTVGYGGDANNKYK